MAFGDRFKDWFGWGGNDSDPYEEDYYGVGESYGAGDAFDYNDPYKNLSLDDLSNLDYGDDAGWGDLFDFGWGDEDYGDDADADDYWGLGGGYDDAFDFGSLGDDENTAFNEFLSNFDFAGDADWSGGIGDLFDFGGLWTEGDDPDDQFDIGAGYDDAFGDIFGGDTKDPNYSILSNLLFGQEYGEDQGGIFSGDKFPKLAGFLNKILGGTNKAVGTVGGGIGSLLNSTLGQLAMLNYMKNKNKDIMDIPVGYGNGAGGGDGSPIDYRVFNLQPALMPGVAYANVGKPEGMKHGGSVYPSVNPVLPRPPFDPRRHWTPPELKKQRGYGQAQEGRGGYASGGTITNPPGTITVSPQINPTPRPLTPQDLAQGALSSYQAQLKKQRGYGQAQEGRGGMKDGGLGDITLARLEPGEFVMTKKATDNIGARNLYKLMKQAEGMG